MAEAQRAQIVEAEDMVGMRVRVEDGIHMPDFLAQGLLAKVRSGIDQDSLIGT
jgi:hypothetical protein